MLYIQKTSMTLKVQSFIFNWFFHGRLIEGEQMQSLSFMIISKVIACFFCYVSYEGVNWEPTVLKVYF